MKQALVTIIAALSALTTGCNAEHWVEFRAESAPPQAVTLESDHVEVPAGIAVGVTVRPFKNNDEMDASVEVELESQQPGILGIDHGLDERAFVIYGAEPGATHIDIFFDGELVGDMPATVIGQK